MRKLLATLCVLGTVLVAGSAHAERRVAFVLGNGTYKFVDPLPNPPIDAKAMAGLFRNAGFEVVEGVDLGREAMTSKLKEFALKTQGADIAVFYYAGHGIAVNGRNYLIPVDADLKSEMDVKFGAAIDIDTTLDQTMNDAKVKLVLLDACRDNPFAAKIRSATRTRAVTVSTGLAEMKSGEGTLIAFATGPGQTALDGPTGTNSPFTRALLNNIAKPGIEIQQAMTFVRAQVNDETQKQQLPWGHTNLTGTVYLNPTANLGTANTATDAGTAAAATPVVASEVELEFWRSIKDTNKSEELNAYLLNYPNGQFRSIALSRLAALQAQPAAPQTRTAVTSPDPAVYTAEATLATEDMIGLDRNKRRDVQKRLNALGFDTDATGKFGDATRRVITRWQTARGYPNSGFFNKQQYQALLAEPMPAPEPRSADAQPERSRSSARRSQGGGGPTPAFPNSGPSPFPSAPAAVMFGIIGGMRR